MNDSFEEKFGPGLPPDFPRDGRYTDFLDRHDQTKTLGGLFMYVTAKAISPLTEQQERNLAIRLVRQDERTITEIKRIIDIESSQGVEIAKHLISEFKDVLSH